MNFPIQPLMRRGCGYALANASHDTGPSKRTSAIAISRKAVFRAQLLNDLADGKSTARATVPAKFNWLRRPPVTVKLVPPSTRVKAENAPWSTATIVPRLL